MMQQSSTRSIHRLAFVMSLLSMTLSIAGQCSKSGTQTVIQGAGIPTGYEVTAIREDRLMNRSWAVLISCEHPGYPAALLPLNDSLSSKPLHKAAQPVIHAGEAIVLFRRANSLHMELAAIAEESGAIGSRIRVHLQPLVHGGPNAETAFSAAPPTLRGLVRGPHQVELEP